MEEAFTHLNDRGASRVVAEVPKPPTYCIAIFLTSSHQRRRETFNRQRDKVPPSTSPATPNGSITDKTQYGEKTVQDWMEVPFQLGNVFPHLDSLYTKYHQDLRITTVPKQLSKRMQKRVRKREAMESRRSIVFPTVINAVFKIIVSSDIEVCIKTQSESELVNIKEHRMTI